MDRSRHHFTQSHDPERRLCSHVVGTRKPVGKKLTDRARSTLARRDLTKSEQQGLLRSAVQNTR